MSNLILKGNLTCLVSRNILEIFPWLYKMNGLPFPSLADADNNPFMND